MQAFIGSPADCPAGGREQRGAGSATERRGAAIEVAFGGQLVQSQAPRIRAEIKHHFDLFSAEFASEGGLLALPHAALLARARR
ncbi:hypothetical protein [Streptomyces sp. NPDC001537]